MSIADGFDDNRERHASQCFKRGHEAVMQQDWEYACLMFRECVKLVPENRVFRISLRGVTKKKYQDNGTGAADVAGQVKKLKATIKRGKVQNDWKMVSQYCEDALAINPWDPSVNADLGDATVKLGFIDIAVFSYECAVAEDPNNVEYLRTLGRLYELSGHDQKFIECFSKITRIDPSDEEARQVIVSIKAPGRSPPKTMTSEEEPTVPLTFADLDLAIQQEPDNAKHYLRLADLHYRDGQFRQALEILGKALEVSGGEIKIRERMEDVELDWMCAELAAAKTALAKDPEDQMARRKCQEFKSKLLEKKLKVYGDRIERYPLDLALKYDLALCYMQDRRHRLSIPLFMQLRDDPRRRIPSLIQLGKCLVYDKQYRVALRQFEQAAPDCHRDDNPELFEELHYFMRRVRSELDGHS